MNWQEERDATLCEARCVVVKVGSAVLSTGSELNLPCWTIWSTSSPC